MSVGWFIMLFKFSIFKIYLVCSIHYWKWDTEIFNYYLELFLLVVFSVITSYILIICIQAYNYHFLLLFGKILMPTFSGSKSILSGRKPGLKNILCLSKSCRLLLLLLLSLQVVYVWVMRTGEFHPLFFLFFVIILELI